MDWAGYFVYDEKYLFERADLIKSRINSINLEDIKVSKFNDHIFMKIFLN